MNYLDTNYLIRYLTNDLPNLAKVALKTIEKSKNLFIPSIVLAETVWILENKYNFSKNEVIEPVLIIIKQDNINTPKFCFQAINIYQKENIDFYDCLVIADAIENKATLHTFDKKMMRIWRKYRQV